MNNSAEIVEALRSVVEAFAESGARYYVGGSLTSSYHGALRSTMDVDLVADIKYLRTSAKLLGVDDLLNTLLEQNDR